MLSYQHGFHAGNLADVQKHALMAVTLDYMTRKDKPLSYIETHAGRGLYDLSGVQAEKTGEAREGILKVADWFGADHPYTKARERIAEEFGETIYPGSPALAQALFRDMDTIHLAELHPGENEKLQDALPFAHVVKEDGFAFAQSICPPTPRRGVLLIDPPYEIKSDYATIPTFISKLHRKWNVGVIALWYPILTTGAHVQMTRALEAANFPGFLKHEVRFPPAREGHGMIGSGMIFVNAPYGLTDEVTRLTGLFRSL
ncbi:23S rRNA (adenine(2030)-N(6))-methyltransferase RlmJ [Celeribacter litoreus]|uniref:23S rRNA (adenine(2030)-N(6))-methyltransferase RlmJ n=1 Tax=Celeribacter litoreus TaxID=2876714 RepID=UPI001CCE3D84|nr:23S rRNA (adenine(2030)-N(6))-methyltransferase RlmJ [Celeribacter litoreus]MCA0043863.1 23S rRNA (adenine(2030)-N(6))-methyltransferase RlmJ [Celeribacter litoreus]